MTHFRPHATLSGYQIASVGRHDVNVGRPWRHVINSVAIKYRTSLLRNMDDSNSECCPRARASKLRLGQNLFFFSIGRHLARNARRSNNEMSRILTVSRTTPVGQFLKDIDAVIRHYSNIRHFGCKSLFKRVCAKATSSVPAFRLAIDTGDSSLVANSLIQY